MSTIKIVRKHNLSHKKARAVAEKIAKDLQKRFELEYEWDADEVDFERPGVSGRLAVAKDQFLLDVKLGWLTSPFKTAFENEINAQFDKLIGKA